MIRWTRCDDSRNSREYWNRRLEENWQKPYHGMFFNTEDEMAEMNERNFQALESHLFRYAGSGRMVSVLELGCGNGRYVEFLRGTIRRYDLAGINYIGFDYGAKSIEEAREKVKSDGLLTVNFVEDDIRKVPDLFQEVKFDLIFMVSVLTSIEADFIGLVERCAGMLKDDEARLLVLEQFWTMSHVRVKRI